ncbi:hypothetical protein VXQ18_06320 [Brucella abortus]|nr:hypothetical protein [Brucella abortus]
MRCARLKPQALPRWKAAKTGAKSRSSPSIRPTPRTMTMRSMPNRIRTRKIPAGESRHRRHRRCRRLCAARLSP